MPACCEEDHGYNELSTMRKYKRFNNIEEGVIIVLMLVPRLPELFTFIFL